MPDAEVNVRVRDFRLLKLTLVDVGPFREYTEIDFRRTAVIDPPEEESAESAREPSNFFLLLSKNGYGKTTSLEAVAMLLRLTGLSESSGFGHIDLDEGRGQVQADFRGVWTIGNSISPVVLSICAGSETPIFIWTKEDLDTMGEASNWAKVCFVRSIAMSRVEFGSGTNDIGRMFVNTIRNSIGEPPPALFGEGFYLPTILYFPADRALQRPPVSQKVVSKPVHWGYQPSFRFDLDGSEWGNSLDNLFAWLLWLGDGRDELLRDHIKRFPFMDEGKGLLEVDRERLETRVRTKDGTHPLYCLSHGERQLLQLLVRTPAHMTASTILLIDEVEAHLHPRWRVELMRTLKQMVRDIDGLSIIMTTHERELIHVFEHDRKEEGLIKGGYLIERDM